MGTDLKVKEKAVMEKASTIFKRDEMLTDKKKNLEVVDDTARYFDRKIDLAKKELSATEDNLKWFLISWARQVERLR